MPALTIKNFPKKLFTKLRREAESRRRSVTQEVLRRLEDSIEEKKGPDYHVANQVTQWSKLAAKWKSNLTVKEEIDDLYRARKGAAGLNFEDSRYRHLRRDFARAGECDRTPASHDSMMR